jgi:hypothetical protein
MARTDIGKRCANAVRKLSDIGPPEPLPLPKGSSFCEDDTDLTYRLQQARALADMFDASPANQPWAATEYEQARKATLQSGAMPHWHARPTGLVTVGTDVGREGFAAVRRKLEAVWPTDAPIPRYKRGTQHSFPDYLTTDTSLVLHALIARAARDFPDATRISEKIARIFDEPQPISNQAYQRAGPIGKAQDIMSVSLGRVAVWGTAASVAPRRRPVNGAPAFLNMMQLPSIAPLKVAITKSGALYNRGPGDVAQRARAFWLRARGKWWSDDLSSFDQSVSDEHQRAMIELVYRPLLGDWFAEFNLATKDLPLISGPLDSDDAAFIYHKKGQTASGDVKTAIDGGVINGHRIYESMAAGLGCTVREAEATEGTAWIFFCQGDDTLFSVADGVPFNIDAYVARSESLGFKTKLQDGAVFLMHHIDYERGVAVALASRVFQQTVFNEYGGEAPEMELASYVARASRATKNPWYKGIERLIFEQHEARWPWPVRTLEDATLRLATPEVQERLAFLTKAKPRLASRFRALPPSAVSDLLLHLYSGEDEGVDVDAVGIHSTDAESDAYRLAEWMSLKKDARPESPNLSFDLRDLVRSLSEPDDDSGEDVDGIRPAANSPEYTK